MVSTSTDWFIAFIKPGEKTVMCELRKLGIEYYIPQRFQRRLCFVQGTLDTIHQLSGIPQVKLSFIKERTSDSYISITPEVLKGIMRVSESTSARIHTTAHHHHSMNGRKIWVNRGEYAGIEAHLLIIGENHYVVIEIPHILSLHAKIDKTDYITEPEQSLYSKPL